MSIDVEVHKSTADYTLGSALGQRRLAAETSPPHSMTAREKKPLVPQSKWAIDWASE